ICFAEDTLIKTEDGYKKTTPTHPFWVIGKGWVAAGDMEVGDKVYLYSGDAREIKELKFEHLDSPIKVYNFEVEDWHTYFVSEQDVFVHNSCGDKSRNKPKQSGHPNSVEIQRDANGNIKKYTEFGPNGEFVKEVRITGKEHGNIPRPNVKIPDFNTNPKTGETFLNRYIVRAIEEWELPK
ncbi:polymorphic toxin-type HINT domain-containing protein, partial [Acetivibrio saccincola]|uniref:polymorphic toxin-type HINT domain-containing protein n=1 Tax=Acetivibrio saccincola TaxID=1677857 RepID=UPI0016A25E1A